MIEKRNSQRLLYRGKFLDFVEDSVTIDTEPPIEAIRQYFKHPGGVCVLPINDDNEIILVKQYRTPIDTVLWEIPAGKIDPNEKPLETAKRELREETGYTAETWIDCGFIYPCPGYSDEKLYLFIAKKLIAGETDLDYGEIVSTSKFTMDEIQSLIKSGEMRDAKTLAALFLLQKFD